jgi:hypothetical protein
MKTKGKGMICHPTNESVKCYAEDDFAGNWNPDNKDTAQSRSGYIIKYAGAPLSCGSKLQMETALSATEVEYIVLSTAWREVISIIDYLEEAKWISV